MIIFTQIFQGQTTRRDNSAFRYQTLPDIVPEDLSVLNVAIDCIDGDRDEGSYF